VKAEGQQIS